MGDFEAKQRMFALSLVAAYSENLDYFQHVLDILGSFTGDCPQALHSMGSTLFQKSPALLEQFFCLYPWARHPEELAVKDYPSVKYSEESSRKDDQSVKHSEESGRKEGLNVDKNSTQANLKNFKPKHLKLKMSDVSLCSTVTNVSPEMSSPMKLEINGNLKRKVAKDSCDNYTNESITVKKEYKIMVHEDMDEESANPVWDTVITCGNRNDIKINNTSKTDIKIDNTSKTHFSQYGEIDNINLKTDPATNRSRGFAFVVFKNVEGLNSSVNAEHNVKGKKVAVKKAQAKQGKIYVGKLKAELSDDDIKAHFAQFGTIAAVEQPFDKVKNERKNFCFITFEREDAAKKLLKEGSTTINGVELEVKKVTPKPDPRAMMGMGRGGRGGGGFGGYGPYGDYYGGGYGYGDPYGGYGGYGGGWGGYGGGWGGFDGGYGGKMGGRGAARGAAGGQRGRGIRGQRQTPY